MGTETIPDAYVTPKDGYLQLMPLNEWRWTLPWALAIDHDGRGWLWDTYPAVVQSAPRGTMCMRVLRKPEGYIVDLTHVYDKHWLRENQRGPLPHHSLRVIEFR